MKRLAAASVLVLAAAPLPGRAQPAAPAAAPRAPLVVLTPEGPASAVNPTGRTVVLTTPLMQDSAYLGDVTLTLAADGRASFPLERLLALLDTLLAPDALVRLKTEGAQGEIGAADLQAAGVRVRYNPSALQLELEITSASRRARTLSLGGSAQPAVGSYVPPAQVSAYLNVRGSFDWVQQGAERGLDAPILFLDGAARAGGVVLESEADLRPGASDGPRFLRRGARLVHDDLDRLVRWTAGDLRPLARGFQSAPEIAGFSASRFYSVLDPQTIIRPRGGRSFRLERRAVVEVRVNNQLIRRLELEPGAYDLQDFPFTQGANDVSVTIRDEVGRTETLNFNLFLDQAQLASGLSEFGVYAGVLSPMGLRGPVYGDTPAASGFYRRGVSDRLTLGVNGQVDTRSWMAGAEAVLATPIGSFAGSAAASDIEAVGAGWAGALTFQRTISRRGAYADALSLSVEARSRDFGPIGVGAPLNPYRYVLAATYSASLGEAFYAGLDARYSRGRRPQGDASSLRGTLGWTVNRQLSLTSDIAYEQDDRGDRVGVFVSLIYRLSQGASVRADYDSRYDRGRLSYQAYRGAGTGAYAVQADVERSDLGSGAVVNATYYGNRAELGFSHLGAFENDLGRSTSQRSSLRFGASFAYADGAVSMGRPIYDAFALVKAHPSLKDAEVLVDPAGDSFFASTGRLGSATQGSLSSYSERSILVTAPDAPLGANLGDGAFRLLPPYKAGYRLDVGSAYNVTAVGRLLTADGAPLALVTGAASEVDKPQRPPITLFTNADGRFGVTGLAPGRWRVVMADPDATSFEIVIPRDAEGAVRLGDLSPVRAAP